MSHDHRLSIDHEAHEHTMRMALLLTGGFMVVEVIGGLLTNSLALLSDAAHMFTDTAALAIALAAIRIGKRVADGRRTFGYARFEILAAAFNAVLLFLVAVFILWEAIQRFRSPLPIHSMGMGVIALLGLIVNLIAMRLLRAGSEQHLNVKGAYLEVWSDMLGSLGVVIASLIIYFTDWKPIDPIIAMLISLWVLPRTWVLLRDSLNILLEGVPSGLVLAEIDVELRSIPGIMGVHDLHVWAVSSGKNLLTAHIVRDVTAQGTDSEVLAAIRERLKMRFDLHHTTLQFEHVACASTVCQLRDDDHRHG